MPLWTTHSYNYLNKLINPQRLASKTYATWINFYSSKDFNQRCQIILETIQPLHNSSEDLLGLQLAKSYGSTLTVMKIRTDILQMLKDSPNAQERQILKNLDLYFMRYLRVAFCVDNLKVERITFNSSANVLEKVARGDSVHKVKTLKELKERFVDGRRCYALFHYRLPYDTIAFIHIGLTNELASSLK